MKASIIQIGNSRGLRIPKPILKQCGFEDEVELEVHDKKLVIKSTAHARQNWAKQFKTMSQNGDDNLLEYTAIEWDEDEWEWK